MVVQRQVALLPSSDLLQWEGKAPRCRGRRTGREARRGLLLHPQQEVSDRSRHHPLEAQRMRSRLVDKAEYTAAQPVAVTKGTPLVQASEKYFANLEARGLDAKSIRTYRTGVDPLVQTCKKACVEDVTKQDMIDFMGWLRKQPLPKRRNSNPERTYSNKVGYVAIFLKEFGVSRLLKKKEYPRYHKKKVVAHPDSERRTGSSLSETVGIPVSSGFHNRIQSEKVECLHRPVLHCGDSERPHLFAVRFRDVNTSKRLRLVTSPLQLMYRLCLLLQCVPDFSVHTRSFLASIFRHSPNTFGVPTPARPVHSLLLACLFRLLLMPCLSAIRYFRQNFSYSFDIGTIPRSNFDPADDLGCRCRHFFGCNVSIQRCLANPKFLGSLSRRISAHFWPSVPDTILCVKCEVSRSMEHLAQYGLRGRNPWCRP